jgi:hypothetical protein
MIYRRAEGAIVWHFCTNCPKWPAAGKCAEADTLPANNQKCDECSAKHAKCECQKLALSGDAR